MGAVMFRATRADTGIALRALLGKLLFRIDDDDEPRAVAGTATFLREEGNRGVVLPPPPLLLLLEGTGALAERLPEVAARPRLIASLGT